MNQNTGYHITRRKYLYKISKEGLVPKKGARTPSVNSEAVYYIEKLEEITHWKHELYGKLPYSDLVVLTFDTSGFSVSKTNLTQTSHISQHIAADKLRLLQAKDAATGGVIAFEDLEKLYGRDFLSKDTIRDGGFILTETKLLDLNLKPESITEARRLEAEERIEAFLKIKWDKWSKSVSMSPRRNYDGSYVVSDFQNDFQSTANASDTGGNVLAIYTFLSDSGLVQDFTAEELANLHLKLEKNDANRLKEWAEPAKDFVISALDRGIWKEEIDKMFGVDIKEEESYFKREARKIVGIVEKCLLSPADNVFDGRQAHIPT
ncbi:MAG: hypothetical protein FWE53_04280 [Firmicutes bacterium]|nr:hypothetical protein [Bacillota bacterium]